MSSHFLLSRADRPIERLALPSCIFRRTPLIATTAMAERYLFRHHPKFVFAFFESLQITPMAMYEKLMWRTHSGYQWAEASVRTSTSELLRCRISFAAERVRRSSFLLGCRFQEHLVICSFTQESSHITLAIIESFGVGFKRVITL